METFLIVIFHHTSVLLSTGLHFPVFAFVWIRNVTFSS